MQLPLPFFYITNLIANSASVALFQDIKPSTCPLDHPKLVSAPKTTLSSSRFHRCSDFLLFILLTGFVIHTSILCCLATFSPASALHSLISFRLHHLCLHSYFSQCCCITREKVFATAILILFSQSLPAPGSMDTKPSHHLKLVPCTNVSMWLEAKYRFWREQNHKQRSHL